MVKKEDFIPLLMSVIIIAACTFLAFILRQLIDPVNLAMIYLVGVVLTAARYGKWPSVLASLLGVCAFNYLFVEPYYTFRVTDDKYYVTFVFLLTASLIVSSVAAKLKRESENVQRQNVELHVLYEAAIANAIARAEAAKLAEEQSLQAEKEKLRNTLLSAVGHDLRTPLASITGAASNLAQQPHLPPQAAELAHSIHGEASRLNKLVRNLLDVTRMESGNLSLNRQPYFINELIGSALQGCKESLNNRKVELHVDKDLPLLNLDGMLTEQTLINLLENAARYTPEHGSIAITATQTAYAIEISIADSGIGIPAGSELAIFERYKRLSEKKTEGMGLGLAICKAIVEAHGGNIWARNHPDGGAIFTFSLPFQFNKITLPEEAA